MQDRFRSLSFSLEIMGSNLRIKPLHSDVHVTQNSDAQFIQFTMSDFFLRK